MRLSLGVAAWLAGVILGLQVDAPALPVLLFLLAVVPVGGLLFTYRVSLWPVLLAGFFLLGLLRVEATGAPSTPLVTEDGQAVTVLGRVIDDPEATGRRVKLRIAVESVDRGEGWEPLRTRALAYAEPPESLLLQREPPYFRYGDRLRLEGVLERPLPIADFDYPSYLANQGISGILWSRETTLVSQGVGSRWRGWIFELRRKLSASIEDSLGEPQSAMARALLLGQRGGLPAELAQDFRDTGTSHLLAISGLHVGILLTMSLGAAVWLMGRRRQLYLVLPLAFIWLYAMVSGGPPSVVRAATMGTVFLAALALGRPRSILPALALSAAAMVAVNPEVIRQVSFQLSFAAMAGIAVALPYQAKFAPDIAAGIARRTGRQRPWATYALTWLVSALIVALAATLATWPLVAFNFHRIPLLGIFITILALPALPFILLGALATAAAGLVHPAIGQLLSWITWAPLSYLVGLVSQAPQPAVSGAWVGDWLVWAWYIMLGGLLLLTGGLGRISQLPVLLDWLVRPPAPATPGVAMPSGSTMGLAGLAFVLAPAAIFIWAQLLSGPDGKLHVYFFDVGQGDSTLIVTPSGRQVLVDGGPESDSATGSLTGPLSAGDQSLDLVLLTHMDADHSRGLLEVLERYRVGSVLVGLEQPDSSLYPQWSATLERKKLPKVAVEAGYEILLEPGITLEVVHPPSNPIGGPRPDRNNNGVVLRLVYGGVSFLLASDIEAEAENYLAVQGPVLESTVLKVPHHGSKTSTTKAFLARVDPAVAVVSVGEGNRFKHPSPEVVQRLGESVVPGGVYRTDQDGTIEFITNGETLWVRTER